MYYRSWWKRYASFMDAARISLVVGLKLCQLRNVLSPICFGIKYSPSCLPRNSLWSGRTQSKGDISSLGQEKCWGTAGIRLKMWWTCWNIFRLFYCPSKYSRGGIIVTLDTASAVTLPPACTSCLYFLSPTVASSKITRSKQFSFSPNNLGKSYTRSPSLLVKQINFTLSICVEFKISAS